MLNREVLRMLFSAATRRRFTWAMVGSVIMALAEAVAMIAVLPLMELLTGSSTDSGVLGFFSAVLGDPPESRLAIYLAIMIFVAFLLKGLFAIAFKWWVLGFMFRQESATSVKLLHHYLTAPYGLHVRRSSPDLIRTMNDATAATYQQVVVGTINLVAEAMTILAISLTLLMVAPVPALIMMTYLAIAGMSYYVLVKPVATRAGDRLVSSWFTIYQSAMHAIGGIKEIRLRHKTGFFLNRYVAGRDELTKAQRTAVFFGELPKYVLELLFMLGIAIMTGFVFASAPTSAALSLLALFAAAGFRLLPSAVRVLSSANTIRLGRPSLALVLADLRDSADASATSAETNPAVDPRLTVRDKIRVDGVTFTHEGGTAPVLKDISFDIPVGSAVALVGASGAGKSTMIDVLLGLHTPQKGAVRVDGQNIHNILSTWQKSLGLVPQEVYLMDGDLQSNITFGELDAEVDPERLQQAIRRAQLTDFITGLPEGLESSVGERGVRLSGGQKQRIGIARALYPQPELLILDEATSALDNHTERLISDTVAGLQGQVTTLIVAHRLSTVRHCDQIIYLEDGRVSSVGTFDQLRERNEGFARLVELGSLN